MVRSLQLVEVRPYAEEEEQAVGDRGVGEFLQARQAPLYFSSTFTRFRDIVGLVLQHATFAHPTSSLPKIPLGVGGWPLGLGKRRAIKVLG